MDHIREVAAFIVVLGVLVFVHEMGHYLAARWRGVYVEAFSLGFGKAFASWTDRTGTVWKLCWLPLGGYVKLHGHERADDVSSEVRATWKDGQTYQGKSVRPTRWASRGGIMKARFRRYALVAGTIRSRPPLSAPATSSACNRIGLPNCRGSAVRRKPRPISLVPATASIRCMAGCRAC